MTLRVDFGSVDDFFGYGPGCESVSSDLGSTPLCTMRMDADKTIDVFFGSEAPPPPPPPPAGEFTLDVNISNQGGAPGDRVFSTPAGIDCRAGSDPLENEGVCEGQFSSSQVTLTAQAAGGDVFGQWGESCPDPLSTQCVIDNPGGGSISVGASFTPAPPPTGISACITSIAQTSAGPFLWNVQADGSCSAGPVTEYRWWADFNFAGQLPTYVTQGPVPPEFEFEGTGTFDIRLEVADAAGNTDSVSESFEVQ